MKDFINDMIHMTEGEKLVYYWPLWLRIVVIAAVILVIMKRRGR